MASRHPYSPPSNQSPAPPSSCGVLSEDVLFDILSRLPAKDLCRFRVVCRSWRKLITDPLFIDAHAARHPGPLLLAKFRDDHAHTHVMDLSGKVIKQVVDNNNAGGKRLLFTPLKLACLATERNRRCHVLNPATGAIRILPEDLAPEHMNSESFSDEYYTIFAIGQVSSSTGEYKVFRMFNYYGFMEELDEQLCEVFTINGGVDHARWRAVQSPAIPNYDVLPDTGVVVDGALYFVAIGDGTTTGILPNFIVSFNLGREEWRRAFPGPVDGDGQALANYQRNRLCLAELKGSLVLAHYSSVMDLWFRRDVGERGTWVKEYSISNITIPCHGLHLKPLFMLDDERLVLHQTPMGQLLIWDPRTNTVATMEMRQLNSVSLFTGSLLALPEGHMV